MAADENKGEGNTQGNEWEVVSLTASTLAAAPSPVEIKPVEADKVLDRIEVESSRSQFMSQFYVFPPAEHENLPLEPDTSNICSDSVAESADLPKKCDLDSQKWDMPDKSGYENQKIKELSAMGDEDVINFFDEKGKGLTIANMDFKEEKDFQGVNLLSVHSLCDPVKFSSHPEADLSRPTSLAESRVNSIDTDPSQMNADDSLDPIKSPDKRKDQNCNPPCVWWKRHAASLYGHAKEANAFWSVVVAAALMGLVILGQKWQRERWQPRQLGMQFCIKENTKGVASPIFRFKDVLVNSKGHGAGLHGSASAGH